MSFVLQQYLIMIVKLCLALIVWPIYILLMIFWLLVIEPFCAIMEWLE